ncbi:MAG: hypothetical protein WAW96_14780 [Alphaproteobacteria bacterium]
MRQRYKNLSGNSGVTYFEIGEGFIRVWFTDGEAYEYDEAKPGARHVAEMKRLAAAGQSLGTYINQHVRKNFARKL